MIKLFLINYSQFAMKSVNVMVKKIIIRSATTTTIIIFNTTLLLPPSVLFGKKVPGNSIDLRNLEIKIELPLTLTHLNGTE